MCKTLTIISALMLATTVAADDKDKDLQEAHLAYTANKLKAQQALTELQSLQPPPSPVSTDNDANVEAANRMEFKVKRAYHNWPRTPGNATAIDYVIELSYLNTAHSRALQDQYAQWISQGFFIERSEEQPVPKDRPFVSILHIRLVQ